MKKKFAEIQSKEDVRYCNEAVRVAMVNLPEKDKVDGEAMLELIEDKGWYGKLEYPCGPLEVKCSFNIKKAVFHSSQIYTQKGKWRFTRTEFNRNVEFKGEKAIEKNSTDTE